MKNDDRTNLLGMVEQAVRGLMQQNLISIEEGCRLIKWLAKADPSISVYADRMREVIREWCMDQIKKASLMITDEEKTYFVLLEENFAKNTKDF